VNPLDPQSYLDPLQRFVSALPVAYSFAAGLVAALNPCGFIMLPSFAALQLGFGGCSGRMAAGGWRHIPPRSGCCGRWWWGRW